MNSLLIVINTSVSTTIAFYHGLSAVFSVRNNNYISLTSNCYQIQFFKSIIMNNILGFTTRIYNT